MFKIEIIKYQNISSILENDILKIPYYDLIKIEVAIKIYINNNLFFTDDYFPLLEFIYQFEHWSINQPKNIFEFNSIEATENPILSFQIINENCIFNSVWKLTSDLPKVKLKEVIEEINNCKEILLQHIK